VRDRVTRWGWPQVQGWLKGETVFVPTDGRTSGTDGAGTPIKLKGKVFTRPERFALAAADADAWEEAQQLMMRGELATWADEIGVKPNALAVLRSIRRQAGVSDDLRLTTALKALNDSMPLVCRGEIVNPGWLLANPERGYGLISGPIPDVLDRLDTEAWLGRLKARDIAIREKARALDITPFQSVAG
jgi:primosomal replication protein N''